jgi:hypothetical protein
MTTYNIGDEVFASFCRRYSSGNALYRGKVTKITKTQITVAFEGHGPERFMIDTGRRVGQDSMYSYVFLIDRERFEREGPILRERARKQKLASDRRDILVKMDEYVRRDKPEAEYQELLAKLVALV